MGFCCRLGLMGHQRHHLCLAAWQMGLDLLWTGIVAGSLAYGIHRLREAFR